MYSRKKPGWELLASNEQTCAIQWSLCKQTTSKQQANNKQTTSKKILDNEMKFTKKKKYFVHTYDSLRPLTYSDKLAAQFLAIFFFLQTNSISRENEEFQGA